MKKFIPKRHAPKCRCRVCNATYPNTPTARAAHAKACHPLTVAAAAKAARTH